MTCDCETAMSFAVSTSGMRLFRGSLLGLPIVLAVSILGIAQDKVPASPQKSAKPADQPLYFPSTCTTDRPVYADASGKPIWLDNSSLLKSATHCVAPKMAPLSRELRIGGYVMVDILVNDKGRVFCVQRVSGHPMLAGSAVDAAKEWTFQSRKQEGSAIWFYGHLRFHFSTEKTKKDESSCTIARW
jgi:TonB family protein